MTFQVVGEKGKNVDFQNRCWGGVMSVVVIILGAALNSNALQGVGGVDLTTQESKDQALKFAKLTHLSSDRVIANLVLLNPTIAANPDGVDDSAIEYQIAQSWLILIGIG
jgi:hypothetical protein